MTIPIIHTQRLILRPLLETDIDDYYEYAQDPKVYQGGIWEPYPTFEAAQTDLKNLINYYERGLMWWGIEDGQDHKLIGRCQLGDFDREDDRADLSYALHRAYWGHGYMTEAATRIMRYGFEELALNRIGAIALTDNDISIHLLEKLGMSREGLLRQQRKLFGVYRDIYIYGILREEWLSKIVLRQNI